MLKFLSSKKITPHLILLGLLLLIGCFLRFYNLGNIILYWDEPLHCIRIAYQPLPFVVANNDASSFFTLLVHFLLPLGKVEIMARLPSAIFGILSILTVYFLGKVFFSKKEGLIAALFVTFSPLLIRFSQYSRAYATYILFSLLSLYFFLKATKENKTKFWLFYCLANIINVYNHLFSLLILPAFGAYVVIISLKGLWKKRGMEKKNYEFGLLIKFTLWTFLVLFIVFFLYLPDGSGIKFTSAAIGKVMDQPENASLSFFQIKDIIRDHLASRNSFYFFVFLFFAFIGLFSSIKKHGMDAILSIFYIFLPFILFILIKPNRAAILSVERYLIFILPVIFLFISKGITFAIALISSSIAKIRPPALKKIAFGKIITWIILLILIGRGFDYKHYYLNFWRLVSFKIEKEVSNFLKENVKEDAFIYFDSFPTSKLTTIVNPLTKDLKIEEIEMSIRKDFESNKDDTQYMVFRIQDIVLGWYIKRDVELWAVTKLDLDQQKKILPLVNELPQIKATNLSDHTILHFEKSNEPLSQKMTQMAEIFLSIDRERSSEKELRLWAAFIYLRSGRFDEGIHELTKAQEINLTPAEARIKNSPLVFKCLDKILGLSDQKIRQINNDSFSSDLAKLLFAHGDLYRQQEEYTKALKAYSECLALTQAYDLRITNRLGNIAYKFYNTGQIADAIPFLKKALQIGPKRYDLNLLLAESYRRESLLDSARKEYKRTFEPHFLSPQVLETIFVLDPMVLIWVEDSSVCLIFRSEKTSHFSGTIYATKKIKSIEKRQITKKDSLAVTEKKIKFDLSLNKGNIKTLAITTQKNCKSTLDIRINGRRDRTKIIILDSGKSPQSIPFSLK